MTRKDTLAAFAKSKTSGVPGCPECGVHTDRIPGVGPVSHPRPRKGTRRHGPFRRQESRWPIFHRTIS